MPGEQQKLSRVHIIHAGEDKGFLNGLSDALEKVANPEYSCEYRFYIQEDEKSKKIVDDVNQFVPKCGEKRNKCMIIISERISLTKSQADNITNAILSDCSKEDDKFSNVVLFVLKENKLFSDSKLSSMKVPYDNDLEKVAKAAVNIWFNTESQDAKKLKKLAVALGVIGGTAVAGVAVVAAAPVILGFGAGGIAAGSIGASMMSASAIASGGGVAAGSLVAILQSLGATGLTAGAAAAGAGAGGTVGLAVTAVAAGVTKLKNLFKKK